MNMDICSSDFGSDVNGTEYEKNWSIFSGVKIVKSAFDHLLLPEPTGDRNNGLS